MTSTKRSDTIDAVGASLHSGISGQLVWSVNAWARNHASSR